MKHLNGSSQKPLRVALISIQPFFAEKILTGEKVVEFRRSWATNPVDLLVVYSSSPVRRIVLVARVANVVEAPPSRLWDLAKKKGGGVTKKKLFDYLAGKAKGYGIELADIVRFKRGVDPKHLFSNFRAPQSFRYLSDDEYATIIDAIPQG